MGIDYTASVAFGIRVSIGKLLKEIDGKEYFDSSIFPKLEDREFEEFYDVKINNKYPVMEFDEAWERRSGDVIVCLKKYKTRSHRTGNLVTEIDVDFSDLAQEKLEFEKEMQRLNIWNDSFKLYVIQEIW